jgi:hypothetical protein
MPLQDREIEREMKKGERHEDIMLMALFGSIG